MTGRATPPASQPAGPHPRPGEVCRRLLAALDASEGRRRNRKRDTRPDAIGLTIKRRLLEEAVLADPETRDFENWLAERCDDPGFQAALDLPVASAGSVRAMARDILAEWHYAQTSPSFRRWLREGAPSADSERGR